MSWDPYLDLDTGVLRNRLGITDPADLARVENNVTAIRIAQLYRQPLPGQFSLAYLQAIHQAIFSDLYEWAGELRTVSIGKGCSLFCPPAQLRATGERIFAQLARLNNLARLDRDEFVTNLAGLYAALNSFHGFREGSGRSNRALLHEIARRAGYRLSWTAIDKTENNAASRAAHIDGDTGPLRAMLDRIVGPLPRL